MLASPTSSVPLPLLPETVTCFVSVPWMYLPAPAPEVVAPAASTTLLAPVVILPAVNESVWLTVASLLSDRPAPLSTFSASKVVAPVRLCAPEPLNRTSRPFGLNVPLRDQLPPTCRSPPAELPSVRLEPAPIATLPWAVSVVELRFPSNVT